MIGGFQRESTLSVLSMRTRCMALEVDSGEGGGAGAEGHHPTWW